MLLNCFVDQYQVVERFTGHYVFALGVARFFSCAHWILQVRKLDYFVACSKESKILVLKSAYYTVNLTHAHGNHNISTLKYVIQEKSLFVLQVTEYNLKVIEMLHHHLHISMYTQMLGCEISIGIGSS